MSAPGREPHVPRKLGFWMCLALVVGNVVGSGVYLLPASLAPLGRSVFAGWLVTAVGALALGVVFAALSRELRGNGGPYAATRAAFGPLAGFVVAWGYWVSIWVGNVTIATGAVSYTSALVPWIASVPGAAAVVTVAVVWLLTFVNCFGVRAVGWVQAVTTVLKSLPLVVVPLAVLLRLRPEWLTTLAAAPAITLDGTSAAATLALWAVVGFESGTVPADKVEDPARTIPRSTLAGTLISTLLCALACSAVMLVVPSDRLAVSNAPFADAARVLFGEGAAVAVAALAAVSAYGALNGWILLQGELPYQMAKDGVFPRAFARSSRRGAPVFALVSTSLLITLLGAGELGPQPGGRLHLHGLALDHGQPGGLPRVLARAPGARAAPRDPPARGSVRGRRPARRRLLALGDRRCRLDDDPVGRRADPGGAAGLLADAALAASTAGTRRAVRPNQAPPRGVVPPAVFEWPPPCHI